MNNITSSSNPSHKRNSSRVNDYVNRRVLYPAIAMVLNSWRIDGGNCMTGMMRLHRIFV